MKRDRIIYWIATGLLSLLMLMSAGMYFFNTPSIRDAFSQLGYPSYLVYPLAIAKVLAIIAILTNFSRSLKQWAYAGLAFDFILALTAHLVAKDGGHISALIALTLLTISVYYDQKLYGSYM